MCRFCYVVGILYALFSGFEKMEAYALRKRPRLPINYSLVKKKKKGDRVLAQMNREIMLKEEQLELIAKSMVLVSKHLEAIDLEQMEELISSDEGEDNCSTDNEELSNVETSTTGEPSNVAADMTPHRSGQTIAPHSSPSTNSISPDHNAIAVPAESNSSIIGEMSTEQSKLPVVNLEKPKSLASKSKIDAEFSMQYGFTMVVRSASCLVI